MPRIKRYERALARMHKELENLCAEQDIKVTIKYRVKSLKNLYDKLCRRLPSLPAGTDHIIPTDLMGMRIVCPFLSDIDAAARLLIETRFSVTEKEQKGADLGFKEFGYESLHFLISSGNGGMPSGTD